MKNFVKFGLALVTFFTVSGASANDVDFSLLVKKAEGKMVNIAFNDTKNVHLSIYNKSGELLFDETIKGKINRKYDLTQFPNGTYYLEAENGTKVNRYEIVIKNKTAEISQKAVAEIYKPVLINNKGIVTVNILNNDKTPVEIKLLDNNNTELYTETISGKATLARKYDINNIAANKLTFIMSYNNKVFTETISARL